MIVETIHYRKSLGKYSKLIIFPNKNVNEQIKKTNLKHLNLNPSFRNAKRGKGGRGIVAK